MKRSAPPFAVFAILGVLVSNVVFPSLIKGLTWTVLRTPKFATIVQASPGAQTVRIAQYQNPLWEWSLVWDYLYDAFQTQNNIKAYAPYTDIRTLIGFFLGQRGKFDSFLYSEPSDNYVGPALITAPVSLQDVTGRTTAAGVVSSTPAILGSYLVGGYLTVTAITGNIAFEVSWTDETGSGRTLNVVPVDFSSSSISATGSYQFPSFEIRAAAGHLITVSVAYGGGATATYDAGGFI